MKLLSSEARNTAAAAISSGLPSRPSGTPAASDANSGSTPVASPASPASPGVRTGPGTSVLTRMLRSTSSAAQVRPNDRIAAFVAA